MINKIIHFSLHNRLSVMIVSALMLIAGAYTASRMEVDVFPDLTSPTVVVMTEAPGMASEEVERLVTFPIETALNGATDVRRVRSATTTGFSTVTVEFDWGTDIYLARQIVAEKLSGIGERLPQGAQTPVLAPQSSLLGEVMVIGLTADSTSLEELRTLADWTLRPRLLSTGGVAQVTVVGGDIREYQIVASPQLMRHYNVSLDELLAATQSMNTDASGGILNQYGNEYIVRGMVRTTSPEEIASSVVKLSPEGTPVTIADIAQVRTGGKTPKMGDASVNGIRAVRLSVTKQPATGTLELTDLLDTTIADIARNLPPDVQVTTEIFRQATFIESSVNNIERALIEGGVLVVVILMIFLGNFRTTIISLLAIPLSLLVSMIVLKVLGFSLNTMSLGGMAIAIGSLVDDAIIDVENVFKRLRENHRLPEEQRKGTLQVVYEASTEIRASIWNATLIIIVTFAPLFFLSGMEGRMLQPLGIAFIVSLFASMIVAITLTPVLGSYLLTGDRMLGRHEREPWLVRRMKAGYTWMLAGVLRHRKIVITTAIVLFVGAVAIFTTLGRNFLPPFNEGSMAISVSALPGTSLEESTRIAELAEEQLMQVPEVVIVSRKTGRAELDEHALGTETSEIDVPFVLKDRSRAEVFADVRQRLSNIKGIVFEIGQPISHRIDLLLSGTRSNIAIKVFGDDLNELFALGNRIKAATQDIPGLVDLNVEQQIERPQLQIKPRRNVLSQWGITPAQFTETVEVALAGRAVSEVYEGERNFDITLKFDSVSRSSMEGISQILLDGRNAAGETVKVPLGNLAELVSTTGPNAINRENVSRKLVVSGNVEGADLRGVVTQIQQRIAEQVPMPEGYHIEYGGQFESEAAASRTLLLTSLLAILIVFMLLYNEFKDLRLTGVVLLNLPLAIIGGVVSIWCTSGIVSIPSIIGFISLFGIATRNGILLISRYRHLACEPEGAALSLHEQILHGSADRLSPIIMTALTSGLALIPLALGGDLPGNEIQSPMAIVILGGLLTSTLLNLFVVPVVYSLMNRKHH
ncbi:efflux RND transporter permease subunit [Millionella massiliensis]|uniref:efflux RND transporter permease subunit n=1 Tax=Millionella massiliensis TaxID=1871023 RepID=UPI0008DA6DCE|nr:efflux RND transporter permease subunit [Millionella massiliensis]